DFIDAVIPDERFALVGSSYGGYLARGIVHRKLAQVDGLLLIVPAIFTDPRERDLPAHVTLVNLPELEATAEERELVDQLMVVQHPDSVDIFRRDYHPAITLFDEAFMNRIDERHAFSFAVDNLPSPFDKPSLFLMGRQDAVCGYRDAWKIIEQYPRATFAVIDKAGHMLGAMESEALCQVLISEWLDRVEAETETAHG